MFTDQNTTLKIIFDGMFVYADIFEVETSVGKN